MSKIGISKKARRKSVDFEYNPPRCINCSHFKPPAHGVPGKHYYSPAACNLHGFEVRPHSICATWLGRDGEELDN